ncbi:site-2 protease family protein [Candidatus Pacearchaeota archaeon]|nr:site-2 protease family protein [Candidatus Pacearchaeota archaeon]
MISLLFSSPLVFVVIFGGLLLSITIHEFAHCWITDKLGDPTPRAQGRLTLDPRVHLDPLGVLAMLFTRFGWGKPAPFDPYNLKNPVKDTAIIAIAGPLSNIAVAAILSFVLKMEVIPFYWLQYSILQILIINIALAAFNLIPVYPLDGSKIITAFLPKDTAAEYESVMTQYGNFILLFLILPWNGVSPASQLLTPIMNIVLKWLI